MKKIIALILALSQSAFAVVPAPATIPNNWVSMGRTGAADRIFEFNISTPGAASNPKFRWHNALGYLELSNDGVTYNQISTGGSPNTPVSAVKTSTYAVLTTDSVVLLNANAGSFTTTVPTAVGVTGKEYTLKRVDSNAVYSVTIAATSAQTFDGISGLSLSTPVESYTIKSDGENWRVIHHDTSYGMNLLKTITVKFGGASNPSDCGSSPCTLYINKDNNNSSWVTSATRTSAGLYVVNFPATTFSGDYSCTVSCTDSVTPSGNFGSAYTFSTTSFKVKCWNGVPVAGDSLVSAVCVGPR